MAAAVQGTPAAPKKHWNEHKHLYMTRPRRTSSSGSSSRRDDIAIASIASTKGAKSVAYDSAFAPRPKTTPHMPPPAGRPRPDSMARRTSYTRERPATKATKASPPLRPRQESVSRSAAVVEVHQPAPPKQQQPLPPARPRMQRGISQFFEYVDMQSDATTGGKSEALSRQRSAEERQTGDWDRKRSSVNEVGVMRDRRASVAGTGRRELVEGKRVRFEV